MRTYIIRKASGETSRNIKRRHIAEQRSVVCRTVYSMLQGRRNEHCTAKLNTDYFVYEYSTYRCSLDGSFFNISSSNASNNIAHVWNSCDSSTEQKTLIVESSVRSAIPAQSRNPLILPIPSLVHLNIIIQQAHRVCRPPGDN